MHDAVQHTTADVAAVIVAFNDAALVRSGAAAAVASGVNRVLVWDNSTDPTVREQIRGLANDRILVLSLGANVGFGSANNRAMELVDEPLVLLVNPDCSITSDALETLIATIDSAPRIAITAPRMMYPSGEPGFAGGGRPSLLKELISTTRVDDVIPRRLRIGLLRVAGRLARLLGRGPSLASSLEAGGPLDMHWVSGFCILARTDVLRRVGGFDDRIFLYFEDVELCERVREAGYRVVLTRSTSVTHIESTSTASAGKSRHYWEGLSTYFDIRGSGTKARVSALMARAVGR